LALAVPLLVLIFCSSLAAGMLWECLLLFIARSPVVFPLFLPYPKLGNTVLARVAPLLVQIHFV
jgi:hypothetical protein